MWVFLHCPLLWKRCGCCSHNVFKFSPYVDFHSPSISQLPMPNYLCGGFIALCHSSSIFILTTSRYICRCAFGISGSSKILLIPSPQGACETKREGVLIATSVIFYMGYQLMNQNIKGSTFTLHACQARPSLQSHAKMEKKLGLSGREATPVCLQITFT